LINEEEKYRLIEGFHAGTLTQVELTLVENLRAQDIDFDLTLNTWMVVDELLVESELEIQKQGIQQFYKLKDRKKRWVITSLALVAIFIGSSVLFGILGRDEIKQGEGPSLYIDTTAESSIYQHEDDSYEEKDNTQVQVEEEESKNPVDTSSVSNKDSINAHVNSTSVVMDTIQDTPLELDRVQGEYETTSIDVDTLKIDPCIDFTVGFDVEVEGSCFGQTNGVIHCYGYQSELELEYITLDGRFVTDDFHLDNLKSGNYWINSRSVEGCLFEYEVTVIERTDCKSPLDGLVLSLMNPEVKIENPYGGSAHVQIRTKYGAIVRTFDVVEDYFVWDGKDNNGNLQEVGFFSIIVTADDGNIMTGDITVIP
jgi:hypothetical protein